MLIAKVLENKSSNQRLIYIPKGVDRDAYSAGTYVSIKPITEDQLHKK